MIRTFLCSFQVKTGEKVMCMKKVMQPVLQAAENFLDILECVQMPLVGFLMVMVMVMVFIYRIFYIHIQMRFTLLQCKGEIGHQHIIIAMHRVMLIGLFVLFGSKPGNRR